MTFGGDHEPGQAPAPWWGEPGSDPWQPPGQPAGGTAFGEPPDSGRGGPGLQLSWWLLGLLALIAAVIGGGIGGAIGYSEASGNTAPTSPSTSLGAPPVTSVDRPAGSVAAVAASVLPSVVSIQVSGGNEQDTGSGIILTPTGYILTNNHVVAAVSGGSGSIVVTLENQPTQNLPARIVGTDTKSDLAVIKINASRLPVARLGNSDALAVGDPVIAIGTPLGLAGTVTTGIVSALNRPVLPTPDTSTAATSALDAIQTDAPINPGNSGGALVDQTGNVIGINAAIATLSSGGNLFGGSQQSGSIGLGFAIPINYARIIAQQLIRTGHAVHPLMGVTVQSGAECPNSGATLPSSRNGALVCSVSAGSPAERAGLRTGDVIIGFDTLPITDSDTLVAYTRVQAIGSTHTITYLRSGQVRRTQVTLASDGGH